MLDFSLLDAFEDAISPLEEAAAYEALWTKSGTTFRTLAKIFRSGELPSAFVSKIEVEAYKKKLLSIIEYYAFRDIGIRVNGSFDYPAQLRDAKYPVELFYYEGKWELIDTPLVAIIGSRKATSEGLRRVRKLVYHLVQDGYTIVSGLAEGIDYAAHNAAIEFGGNTIAVIGTPLSQCYPLKNQALQKKIKENFLLISQVPFIHYSEQDYISNRRFFPERNITMSALTEATIIIEAAENSGTLIQAKAAVEQGRKLFILDSCFANEWANRFKDLGAIRVKKYSDLIDNLIHPL